VRLKAAGAGLQDGNPSVSSAREKPSGSESICAEKPFDPVLSSREKPFDTGLASCKSSFDPAFPFGKKPFDTEDDSWAFSAWSRDRMALTLTELECPRRGAC
jgi:hypothetical protein